MKLLFCGVSLICFLLSGASALSYAEEPMDTVTRYITALTEGNTSEMTAYLGGRLYSKRKVLLEQNESYPEFLSNLYEGAEFYFLEPKITHFDPLQYEVEVQFQYPDGNYMGIRLILAKNSLDEWKIVDETDISR